MVGRAPASVSTAAAETEVMGVTLARTGASIVALTLLASMLLLSGGLLLRRREQEG